MKGLRGESHSASRLKKRKIKAIHEIWGGKRRSRTLTVPKVPFARKEGIGRPGGLQAEKSLEGQVMDHR